MSAGRLSFAALVVIPIGAACGVAWGIAGALVAAPIGVAVGHMAGPWLREAS